MSININELVEGVFRTTLEEVPVYTLPEKIQISSYAIEKAYKICDLVHKKHGLLEWYGLLLAEKANPAVIKEILIPEQENTGGETKAEGHALATAFEEKKTQYADKYLVVGWIHSHASYKTYFSSTDDDNIETVLNSVHLNTKKKYREPLQLIEGKEIRELKEDKLVIGGTLSTDGSLEVTAQNKEALKQLHEQGMNIKVDKPILMGWSYNIVVNNKHEHYSEIAIKTEKPLEDETDTSRYEAELDIQKEEKVLDPEVLEKEINEKVKKKVFYYESPKVKYIPAVTKSPFAWEEKAKTRPLEELTDALADIEGEITKRLVKDTVTREEIKRFCKEALNYDPMSDKNKAMLNSLINEAYREGKQYIRKKERKSTGQILNPELVASLHKYAQKHPDFATFVKNFNDTWFSFNRTSTLEDYLAERKNKDNGKAKTDTETDTEKNDW